MLSDAQPPFVLGEISATSNVMVYSEANGSGNANFVPDSAEATRIFYVNWSQRNNFLDNLLGYTYLKSGGLLGRILPDPHPTYVVGGAANKGFYAQEASIEPWGLFDRAGTAQYDSQGVARYNLAKITVKYRTLDYDLLQDSEMGGLTELSRYIKKTYNYTAEYLTINGKMKFVSGGQTLQATPGRISPYQEICYTMLQVPYSSQAGKIDKPPNVDAITSCNGKVNNALFDTYYPRGTLLFTGVELTKRSATAVLGRRYWDIHYKFLYRSNGAGISGEVAGNNYVWNNYAIPGFFDLPTSDGTITGSRIYQEADFSTMFNAATI